MWLLGVATNASSQPVVPPMLLKARLFGLFPTQNCKILELDQVSNSKYSLINCMHDWHIKRGEIIQVS